jgi:tetratricopeptide (TPR) repeat protein
MKKILGIWLVFGYSLILSGAYLSEDSRIETGTDNTKEDIISLLGRQLVAPDTSAKAKADYEKARTVFLKDPSEDSIIWYGRRAAYLYKYKEAIKIYSEGIKRFPSSHRMYRHRGHRYISIRKFDRAIEDLKRSAELVKGKPLEVEPDGMPNKLNIPLSNSQFNIWYHLGLAFYLKGQYLKAVSAYQECLKWCKNDDLLTATLDWLYMTCRRLGEKEKAAALLDMVSEKMKIIENQAYHSRLLMYKGLRSPESLLQPAKSSEFDEQLNLITQGYGVGNWYFYNGQKSKARKIFEKVIGGKLWSAFGYIAAEVDLARNFARK